MKIILNKNKIEITPSDIKRLKPTYNLLCGRRFNLQVDAGKWIKNVTVNDLISAVINEAKKPGLDVNEIIEFPYSFKILKDKGYVGPNGSLRKENFFLELIIRIKHFFTEIKRKKLLNELDQIIQHINGPALKFFHEIELPAEVQINELEEKWDDKPHLPIEPFNFEHLPDDMQVEILRKLDSKAFLAYYRTCKQSKFLIEKRLSKELKKARLEQQAFFKWKHYLIGRINDGNNEVFDLMSAKEEFDSLIERFTSSSYSKEIIKELDKLFLFCMNKNISKYRFATLIEVTKALSKSNPNIILKILKKNIDIRLLNNHEIKPSKSREVLECLKIMVMIDPTSVIEYQDLLRFNIEAVQNKPENVFDFLEILGLIAPESLMKYQNILRFDTADDNLFQYRKERFLLGLAFRSTKFNLEQIFKIITQIQNKPLKLYGLCVLMHNCKQHSEKFLPLIQQALEISQKSGHKKRVLNAIVEAYIHFGKMEKALETIELMKDTFWKKCALIDLAKAYAHSNPKESLRILEKVNPDDDFYRELMIQVYCLIDIEKAQKICDQMQKKRYKLGSLFAVANILKIKNMERAKQVWVDIFKLASHIDDVREPYLSLLKIVKQIAEVDPNQAKQFLENKLHPINRRELFEGMVKEKRTKSKGFGIYHMSNFKPLVEAYALIDSKETEQWMKEFNNRIVSSIQSSALIALKDYVK